MQYSPNEVKLAVAGDGGAGKDEVQQMVTRLLQLAERARSTRRRRRARARAVPLVAGPARRPPVPSAAGHGGAPSTRRVAAAGAGDRGRGGQGGGERDRVGAGHRARAHAPPARCWSRSGASGYRAFVPAGALPALHPGDAAFLFTHLHVREDAMVLYGFPTRDERDTFEALIAATGVGPKLALAMLSVHSPDALRRAVLDDDLAALTLVPGVGKRTAQRLLVELKTRLDVPELDLTERRARRRRGPRCAPRSRGSGTRPTRCATCVAQLPERRLGRGAPARGAEAAGGDR